MKPLIKWILTVLVALAGIGIAGALIKSKPKAKQQETKKLLPQVEVITAQSADHSVQLASQGEVLAERETPIASEVAGRVLSVSPKFEVGERFSEGDVLLEIDAADYISARATAGAELANAQLALDQEKARAKQAMRDWKALGQGKPATDLVLRKPQLASAEARLEAADAGLQKAERDVLRTKIRAPYDCQIRATSIEVGSFVSPGSPLAQVFSVSGYEVRLPLALEDFAFVEDGSNSAVTFFTELGGRAIEWQGKVIRTEGQIDRASRSVFVVASIEPGADGSDAKRFLSPGLFVKAGVAGSTLKGVFEVPRKALYGKDRILIVSPENRVSFRRVKVLRTGKEKAVIGGGLEAGERVAISPLPQVIDNMEVAIAKQDDAETPEAEPAPEKKEG